MGVLFSCDGRVDYQLGADLASTVGKHLWNLNPHPRSTYRQTGIGNAQT